MSPSSLRLLSLLAFFGGAAADYVSTEVFLGDQCADSPFVVVNAVIDCETVPESGTSFALACSNSSSSGPQILTYVTPDCTGPSVYSSDLPLDTSCQGNDNGTVFKPTCVAGKFVPPTPAANSFLYNYVTSSCPHTADGDLTQVTSYPCGDCIKYNGLAIEFSCNAESLSATYWAGDECNVGDAAGVAPVLDMGCDDEVGVDQIEVTICDAEAADAATKNAPLHGEGKMKDLLEKVLHFHNVGKARGQEIAKRAANLARRGQDEKIE